MDEGMGCNTEDDHGRDWDSRAKLDDEARALDPRSY